MSNGVSCMMYVSLDEDAEIPRTFAVVVGHVDDISVARRKSLYAHL